MYSTNIYYFSQVSYFKWQLHEGKVFCLFCLILGFLYLEQWQTHNKCLCYGLNVASLAINTYVVTVPLSMMVSGGGYFKKVIRIWWRHGSEMRQVPRSQERACFILCSLPREDAIGSQESTTTKKSSWELNHPILPSWSWTSSHRTVNFASHSIDDILI